MIKIFEEITDYISGKYWDFIKEREMNSKDPSYFGEVSDEIAKDIYDFFSELISEEETLTELWTSKDNLNSHFKKHCIGKSNKKSNKKNIRYDFITPKEYEKYENEINKLVTNPKYRITALTDTSLVLNALDDITKNPVSILFDTLCDFRNKNGIVKIGLNSFADNVTTNYSSSTINFLVLSENNRTISLYAVDTSLIKNQFKKTVNKYNSDKKVKKLYNNIRSGNGMSTDDKVFWR